jgi:hypothetical protein
MEPRKKDVAMERVETKTMNVSISAVFRMRKNIDFA